SDRRGGAGAEQQARARLDLREEIELAVALDGGGAANVGDEGDRSRLREARGEREGRGGEAHYLPNAASSGRSPRSWARRAHDSCASCVAPISCRSSVNITLSENSALSDGRCFSRCARASPDSV